MIILLLLIISLSFSVIACGFILASPFHELGHAFVGVLLGVQILKIEWGKVIYVPTNDWRENILKYGGGLFAVIVLYVFIYSLKGYSIF